MHALYEELIKGLLEKGFGSVDQLFSGEEIAELRKVLLKRYNDERFRLAGIGSLGDYQKETSIRSDQIHWLNESSEHPTERLFFERIQAFEEYLNRTCYAGIRSHEFHYAVYEKGSFYKRHCDQFNKDDRRKYSMVIYLTESWEEGDGGELILYADEEFVIQPIPGKIVFFRSDIEHEVRLSKTRRLSLTGWMKTL